MRMEKTEGKEGIALSVVYTWAFFPFEHKNSFTHLLTRTASPLNVSCCVVSGLGSVLTVIHSGTPSPPSPIALAFLCQPHCANLYPSLVSKDKLFVFCPPQVVHCKENTEPRAFVQSFWSAKILLTFCFWCNYADSKEWKNRENAVLHAKQSKINVSLCCNR